MDVSSSGTSLVSLKNKNPYANPYWVPFKIFCDKEV